MLKFHINNAIIHNKYCMYMKRGAWYMNNKNDFNWPLPSTLFSIMNGFHEQLLRGYVQQLSQTIRSSVVAVVKKDEKASDKALKDCGRDDLTIISDNWEERQHSSFCRWMRQNVMQCSCKEPCDCISAKTIICDYGDKDAVLCLANGESTDKITGWEERSHRSSDKSHYTKYYRYKCKMGFIEWLIPIYVNDELQGAFITGQFIPPEYKDNFQIMASNLEANLGVIYTAEQIEEALRNEDAEMLWKEEPDTGEKSDNRTNEFFSKLNRFSEQIDGLYAKTKEQLCASIQHQVLDIAWGNDTDYDSDPGAEQSEIPLDPLTNRFTAIRTYLMDAMIVLRDVFKLKELIVYKPRSDPNSPLNIKNEIQGANLINEKRKKSGDGLPISRAFELAEHNLLINQISTETNDTEKNSEMKTQFIREPEEIMKLFRPNKNAAGGGSIPKDLNGVYMFICLMRNDIDQSVAYCFKPQSEKDVAALVEIMSSISAVFLAQWNGVIAEYNRNIYERANQYLDHELGQALAAIDITLVKFNKAMRPALATDRKMIFDSYPELPTSIRRFLQNSEIYYKNIMDYKDLAGSIIACSFINMKDRRLEIKSFLPYGRFLIRLCNIYSDDFKAEHKKLRMPKVDYNDYEHPQIDADPAMIEQCVNNLLKNSLKYSHSFTNVELTAGRAGDNPNNYEFIITNYGWPIPKNQEKEIFQLGKRGKGIEGAEQTGIGFGLYIARMFARAHGGDVELMENTYICPLNVPLLRIYANSSHSQAENDIREKCKFYLYELQKKSGSVTSIYDQIVAEDPYKLIDSPFSPLAYIRRIDMPTARIRFRLWIPIKMRGNDNAYTVY